MSRWWESCLFEKLREHEGKKLGGPQMVKRLLCCANHRRETLVSLTAKGRKWTGNS